MKINEYLAEVGITLEQFQRWRVEFACSEGYDDLGNEYDTLHDYILSRKSRGSRVAPNIEPRD
jgi:hypothetical protein